MLPNRSIIIKSSVFFLAMIFAVLFANISPVTSVKKSPETQNQLNLFHVQRSYAAYTVGDATNVTEVLSGRNPSGDWVHKFYKYFQGFFNVIIIIVLLLIAFANILSINIETYAVKKILPKIIVAAVFANLAMPIFAILSRVVDSLYTISLFKPLGGIDMINYITAGITTGVGPGSILLVVGWLIVGSFNFLTVLLAGLLIFGAAIVLLLLWMIMSFRPYVVFLAAMVSPVAIALSILPQTQGAFKKWLNIALVWIFLPLMLNAILNLGLRIPTSTYFSGIQSPITAITGAVLPTLLKIGLLIFAIRLPFALEKDISGLIQTAGKYTGGGLMNLSGAASDKAYLAAKKLKDEHAGKTMAEIAKFSGSPDDAAERDEFNKQKAEYLRNTDKRFIGKNLSDDQILAEAPDDENYWDDDPDKHVQRLKDFAKYKEGNAAVEFKKKIAPTVQRIETAGAIASLPFGFIEGRKLRMETMAKERVKSSQKLLARGLSTGKKIPILGELGITGAMIRGDLGDPKYGEAIVEDDLKGNLSVEDIVAYRKGEKVNGMDMYDALVKNAMDIYGLDKKTAQRTVADILHKLNVNAENVGTWKNQPIFEGFNSWQAAVMKVTYKREAEQSLRQNQFGNGDARRREAERKQEREAYGEVVSPDLLATEEADRVAEARRRGRGGAGGAPGKPSGREYPPIDEDDGLPPPEPPDPNARPGHRLHDELEAARRAGGSGEGNAPENPMIESLLAQISTQTKGIGSGIDKVAAAISSAKSLGINDLNSQPIVKQSDDVTNQLGVRLQNMGLSPMAIRRFVTALKSSNGLQENDPTVVQLKQEIQQDPEASGLIDRHTSLQTGYIGALANSEKAVSVQNQATRLAKSPDKIPAVQANCDLILDYKLKPGTIPPDQYSQAIEAIKPYLTVGTITETTGPSGQMSLDVGERPVERLAKSAEAMTVTNPQGERVIITDPVTIQARTALQVKREAEISTLGKMSTRIKGQPTISQVELDALDTEIAKVAGTHFELRTGNRWQQTSPDIKETVIGNVRQRVIDAASKSDDPEASIIENATRFLHEEFAKALPGSTKNI